MIAFVVRVIGGAAAVVIVLLGYAYLTLPDVRLLKTSNPSSTAFMDLRAREAATLGFRRVIVPQSNAAEIRADVEVVGVRRVEKFAEVLFR